MSQTETSYNFSNSVLSQIQDVSKYLIKPTQFFKDYHWKNNFRADLVAGFTIAIIVLPQSIAAALLVELPPTMGLYTAIIGALIGALWGSSRQLHTGTNNPISLLVFSVLLGVAIPGTPNYILSAGILAVMVGVFELLVGFARLGALVNFVSRSVVVGFTAGAGMLIATSQIRYLLGLNYSSKTLVETVTFAVQKLPQTHILTATIGISTMVLLVILRKLKPTLPGMPIVLVLSVVLGVLTHWEQVGVAVVGQLPKQLPPIAHLWDDLSLDLLANLSTGALAVGTISLVSNTAIARSLASQTGQRIDSNQEFIGQGIANVAIGFFSGYPGAGSFSRSAVNLRLGAKTQMSAIFSALFVVLAIFTLAPYVAFLPRAVVAGILILAAYGLIDQAEIARIWQGSRDDAAIMLITFLGTLFLRMEFAVLLGVFLSFALYITKSSVPRVLNVVPEPGFHHFAYLPENPMCPQLATIDVMGDLYFGAVHHIEEAIFKHMRANPYQRYLLLRMRSVNQCDFSGIYVLESIVKAYRERGGDVFMVRVQPPVMELMQTTGFADFFGEDHYLTDDTAIPHIFYHVLDPAICIYECEFRVFGECQNLPKQTFDEAFNLSDTPIVDDFPRISAKDLDMLIHGDKSLLVLDIREAREYNLRHIPASKLQALSGLFKDKIAPPVGDPTTVIVCRTGRRSVRAAQLLRNYGWKNLCILDGGLLAWENSGLLEAVSPQN